MSTTEEIRKEQRKKFKPLARENLGLDNNTQGIDRLAERAQKMEGLSAEERAKLRQNELHGLNINEQEEGLTVHENTEQPTLTVNEEEPTQPDPTQNTENSNNQKAATIKKGDEPLDLGHYDDEKIKMSDGDIIDYLMKEWLEAGIAWCLDKGCGIPSAVLYEGARWLEKGGSKLWRGGKELTKSAASSVYKKLSPDNDNMEDIRKNHQEAIEAIEAARQSLNAPLPDETKKLFERIGSGRLKLQGNKYKFYQIKEENGKQKGEWVDSAMTVEDLSPAKFKAVQAMTTKVQLVDASNILNDQGVNVDMKTLERIYNLKLDQTLGMKLSTQDESLLNNNQQIVNAIVTARKNFLTKGVEEIHQFGSPTNELCNQADLFAEYYAQYVLNNQYSQNPNKRKFNKQNQQIKNGKQKEEELANAHEMFWRFQQARRNGKEVPSNEALIEMAKNQCNKAQSQPFPDEVRTLFEGKDKNKSERISEEKPLTLPETFAGHIAATEVLIQNLETLKKENNTLNSVKDDIERRRERLNRLKERMLHVQDSQKNPRPTQRNNGNSR